LSGGVGRVVRGEKYTGFANAGSLFGVISVISVSCGHGRGRGGGGR